MTFHICNILLHSNILGSYWCQSPNWSKPHSSVANFHPRFLELKRKKKTDKRISSTWHLHEVVRVPAGVDVVQLLEILATALLLVDAPHIFRASARELLLAQRLLRLCTHRRTIVNRHLTLHITPRRFCVKQETGRLSTFFNWSAE